MTQLTLYNCTAERNRLNKGGYLEKVVDLQGVIKEDFSLTNPSIVVALDPNTVLSLVQSGNLVIDDNDDITTKDGLIKVTYSYRSKVLRANYAYIPELNRYYFINEISTQNGKLWTISMSVDVLMSYFAEIKELKAFVTRNEFTYQPELEDERISWKQSKYVDEYVPSSGALVNTSFKTAMNTTPTPRNVVMSVVTSIDFESLPYFDTAHSRIAPPSGSDLPEIETMDFNNSGAHLPYVITIPEAMMITMQLNGQNSNLASFINSMVAFPFEIPNDGTNHKIYVGDSVLPYKDPWNPEITGNRVAPYPLYPFSAYTVVADFTIARPYGDWRDYAPYSHYEVFIPFYGWYEIDASQILDSAYLSQSDRLLIYYAINYDDGSATVYLYNYTRKRVIFSSACVVGVKLPFSSSNLQQVQNQREALGLNTAIGVLTGVLALASGNPVAMAGGILSVGKSLTSAITGSKALFATARQSFGSGTGALFGTLEVKVRKTYMLPSNPPNNNDYAHTYGKPLMSTYTLKDLSGFTICGAVHVEGIKCLLAEQNEIHDILTSGVIL